MKSIHRSRLNVLLVLMIGGFASVLFRHYLPEPLASQLSDVLIASLGGALGVGAAVLRVQDNRQGKAAAQSDATSNVKPLRSTTTLLVLVVLLLVPCSLGCSAAKWDACNVRVTNHPTRGKPAGVVALTCTRRQTCNDVGIADDAVTCDGKTVAREDNL